MLKNKVYFNFPGVLRHTNTNTHSPWGWVPVGIVVPFLWALVATPCSCVVLSGVDGCLSLEVTVGCVESSVTLPQPAVEIVVVVLVHSILKIGVAVTVITDILVLWNSTTEREGKEGGGDGGREIEREKVGGEQMGRREGDKDGGGEGGKEREICLALRAKQPIIILYPSPKVPSLAIIITSLICYSG